MAGLPLQPVAAAANVGTSGGGRRETPPGPLACRSRRARDQGAVVTTRRLGRRPMIYRKPMNRGDPGKLKTREQGLMSGIPGLTREDGVGPTGEMSEAAVSPRWGRFVAARKEISVVAFRGNSDRGSAGFGSRGHVDDLRRVAGRHRGSQLDAASVVRSSPSCRVVAGIGYVPPLPSSAARPPRHARPPTPSSTSRDVAGAAGA